MVVEVHVEDEDAAALVPLLGASREYAVAPDLEGLIAHLVRTAADGVRRPGSWERGWIQQVTGAAL